MRISQVVTSAAILAAVSTPSFAGGLAPEVMEPPVVVTEPVAAAPSINPTFIVLGVLAALLIASGSSSSSSNGDDDNNGEEEQNGV